MTRKTRTTQDCDAPVSKHNSKYEQLIPNDNSSDDPYIIASNITKYQCEFGCHFDKKTQQDNVMGQKARKKLFSALIFCLMFMCVELFGGYMAHSIALMSDALHLFSDCGGIMISIISLWITSKDATKKLTFGYHRAEIIGALFSVFLIWLLTIWLVYQAIDRIFNQENVNGKIMFGIACVGIIVNLVMSKILHQQHHHHHHHHHQRNSDDSDESDHSDHSEYEIIEMSISGNDNVNINVRSAFIHALGDLLQSIGVLISAALIWYDNKRYRIFDPICTLIFSIIVVFTTVNLMRDILSVLMESVPININYHDIKSELNKITDVEDIHDLHIWNISLNKPVLSVHLVLESSTIDCDGKIITACSDSILRKSQNILSQKFNIHHSTIQMEWKNNHQNHNPNISCPSYCNIDKNINSNSALCTS